MPSGSMFVPPGAHFVPPNNTQSKAGFPAPPQPNWTGTDAASYGVDPWANDAGDGFGAMATHSWGQDGAGDGSWGNEGAGDGSWGAGGGDGSWGEGDGDGSWGEGDGDGWDKGEDTDPKYLRPCKQCGQRSYLRNKCCLNPDCVPWLILLFFNYLNSKYFLKFKYNLNCNMSHLKETTQVLDLWAQNSKDAAGRLFSWGEKEEAEDLSQKIASARKRGTKGQKHRDYWAALPNDKKKKVRQWQKKQKKDSKEGDWWSSMDPLDPVGKGDGPDDGMDDGAGGGLGGGLASLAGKIPAYVHIG